MLTLTRPASPHTEIALAYNRHHCQAFRIQRNMMNTIKIQQKKGK